MYSRFSSLPKWESYQALVRHMGEGPASKLIAHLVSLDDGSRRAGSWCGDFVNHFYKTGMDDTKHRYTWPEFASAKKEGTATISKRLAESLPPHPYYDWDGWHDRPYEEEFDISFNNKGFSSDFK